MSIFIFIAILVVLILVHEFGHFIVAKRAGIRVDEFSIGFGPKWFSKKVGETEYTFKPLLAGGYVKIFGENPDEESISGPDSARSFFNAPKWIQAAVIIAGVFFNILLSWFIFAAVFMLGMPTAVSDEERNTVQNPRVVIADVLPDAPAELAGIKRNDTLLSLSAGGAYAEAESGDIVSNFIAAHPNDEITLSVKRGDEVLSIVALPQKNLIPDEPDRAAVGISMGIVGEMRLAPHKAVYEAAILVYKILPAIFFAIIGFLGSAIIGTADFSQVAGPVGIVGLVGDAASLGAVSLLMFTAFISLNLAVINVLPFPALDGGRLLFVIIETIKGSPIKPVVANVMNSIGFALLILLMILITFNDVARLF